MPRWGNSFRSSDFDGTARRERDRGKRQRTAADGYAPGAPAGEGQHDCPRGRWCASATRDEDGTWHPLPVNSAFCPADEAAIRNAVPGLPASWARLTAQGADPFRSRGPAPGGRRPPGSRVLLDTAGDALLRESATVLSGWAARVRAVPGVQHSARQHRPVTLEGVAESCDVLSKWTTQVLALPPGPTLRTWEYLPGKASARPAAVPCRHCGTFISPSPSGKRWWPAVCTHPLLIPAAWGENPDGTRRPAAWACAACSTPFRGTPPPRRPACAHEPSGRPQAPAGGIPADVEDDIAGLEVVRAGDGWVTCITTLSGVDAGLDILDLAARFRRLLGEAPARPETLDGVPCRSCEEIALVAADPPSDPAVKASRSRCTACGDLMDDEEYRSWTRRYRSYVDGLPGLTCRLCETGRCGDCRFTTCSCAAGGHLRAA